MTGREMQENTQINNIRNKNCDCREMQENTQRILGTKIATMTTIDIFKIIEYSEQNYELLYANTF